jgi:hypothetical protein
LFGLQGLDSLTHSLFWSLLVNIGVYLTVSLWRAPSGQEASQALLFVDVFERTDRFRVTRCFGAAVPSCPTCCACVSVIWRDKAQPV